MSCPAITKPVFDHHHSGLGVATSRPRISWRFENTDETIAGWVQTSYEIEIKFASDEKPQSFPEVSDQSVLVPWPARDLSSREAAIVRVRVYGKSLVEESYAKEEPSAWSEPATVEAALLKKDDFRANFITAAQQIGPYGPLRPIRFRKEFILPQELDLRSSSARLYITSLGVFEAWINGKPVTDECMAPGWTSYKHRLVYRILDVKRLLIPGGKNTVGFPITGELVRTVG
ncbi:hypothetical protein CCUS01_07077 [Colletotrichum cuscutae]|uniref:Bacterial alpha-L-rhamnosidase N-terminal domain-containing protein n=1 Tax=Colletotrichum cuscutae TaxID=1209917 RepID=A0AAI9V182_9PEZI|nr:hypothetical protein CCUS01_07077 [Colletotrichum cuscutae]